MRTLIMTAVACALFAACGGSDSSNGDGVQNGASNAKTDAGNGSSPGSSSSGDSGGATTAALDIVFNEVAAVGTSEWIEIANKGDAPVDLGDYYIADSDKTTMEPKKSDAMRFPAGTTMAAGEKLVIIANKKNGTVGPHPKTDCLPDGPEACYFASFGVSATSGEPLHLLAPDGTVVTSTAIPKTLGADAGGATNETSCRIPDVTGDFATCAPTPGQANHAP